MITGAGPLVSETRGGLATTLQPDVTTTGNVEEGRLITAGGIDELTTATEVLLPVPEGQLITAGGAVGSMASSTVHMGYSIQASE